MLVLLICLEYHSIVQAIAKTTLLRSLYKIPGKQTQCILRLGYIFDTILYL